MLWDIQLPYAPGQHLNHLVRGERAVDVLRMAAFSDGDSGGNPAGVLIAGQLPGTMEMQWVAAEVGYSETVFAAPVDAG